MDVDGQSDLAQLDRALVRLRRFFEAPAVLDDDGASVELSTLLVLDAVTCAPTAAEKWTVRDVARQLDVAHSTASRFVTRAERAGAVKRGASGTDRRETVVEATEAGRALAERAAHFRLARLEGITGTWEPRDVAALAALLDRFAIDNIAADPDRRGIAQRDA
ncbi:MarR family winged helix-turn-helix transcriptional regulator [Oerskovia flava]|uniref:MarR family winged helix-turn-helix transcriptional regulator n=1 Tax=Oerskovia flava TaxID=2986422 RepID=UPI0022404E99|nr:MarR family winged helix-turn-helix transcriptional regulator [Oerskovia sp. JB1-3-2]